MEVLRTSMGSEPINDRVIEKTLPLTEPQKEILLSCIIGGRNANLAYNQSISLKLTGHLKETILKDSLALLIARNEALRASFCADSQQMLIYNNAPADLYQSDISTSDKTEQEIILKAYHLKEAETAFDLINGPLIRFALFKLSDEENLITIHAHHIICDGWSFSVILKEISEIYNSKCRNENLTSEAFPLSAYVNKFISFTETQDYSRMEDYWLKEFENKVPQFEVTPDHSRPLTRTYDSRRDDYFIKSHLIEKVRSIAAQYKCSFATTLLSVFEILLYKYTGQQEIIVGVPTAGQPINKMYRLIGHCVNLLPMRSAPRKELAFDEYLKLRKIKTLSDYEHRQFTFGSLIKKLNIVRDPARVPLVPVTFSVDRGMDADVSFEGISHQLIYNPRVFETFEIFLNIAKLKGGYEFQWSYNTNLYEPETIKKLMDGFEFLLQQVIINPETKIGDLAITTNDATEPTALPESDIELIKRYNDTTKVLGWDTLDNLFYSMVGLHPNKVAVCSETTSFTYNELNKKANQIANHLLSSGVKIGDRVAIQGYRDPLTIAYILGIIKAGAIYVPIEPNYPPDRQQFILNNSNIVVTLSPGSFVKHSMGHNSDADVKGHSKLNALAYIIYTSGSTGMPKGVMITHKAAANTILDINERFSITEKDNIIGLSSLSFDLSVYDIFGALSTGATMVMIESITDTQKIGEILTGHSITFWNSVPSVMNLMVETVAEDSRTFPKLRHVLLSGDWIPISLPEKIKRYFPNATITSLGGATEGSIWSIFYPINKVQPEWKSIPYGYPLTNQQFYVLNDKLEFCAIGAEGELFIGGDGVASGYFNNEEKTNYSFINHPQLGYVYRTGDFGILRKEGYIEFRGRKDDQVKIRGFRIELEEIEYQLLKIDGIKDAVTIVREDTPGDQMLVSYITTEKEILPANELFTLWRQELRKHLPEYMVPVHVVPLQQLPVTANGKIDKKSLPKPVLTFKHDHNDEVELSPVTQAIKRIWEEELGIENIAVNDDFFQLGGHSMIAIKVMAKIEKQLGVRVPINTLFQHPSISMLASAIEKKESLFKEDILIPIKKSGTKPPIFLIHGGALNILLYKNLGQYVEEDQPLYGLQALGMSGDMGRIKSIEEIAEIYCYEIEKTFPSGPYILAGYSLGGLIAYEISRQLISKGKEIKVLGILDTNVSDRAYKKNGMLGFGRKSVRQIKKFFHILNNITHYPKDTIDYQLFRLFKTIKKEKKEFAAEQVYDYNAEVAEAYERAFYNYVIQPTQVQVDLFKVKKRIYYVDDQKYLGWKKFALKGVATHRLPGDHKTFLLPPNNALFIKELLMIINNRS